MQKASQPGNYFKPTDTLWTDNGFINPTAMSSSHRLLLNAVNDLTPHHARVCDLGCGNGLLVRRFKQMRPDIKIAGCDMNAAAIGRAPQLSGKWMHSAIQTGKWLDWTPDTVFMSAARFKDFTPEESDQVKRLLRNISRVFLYTYSDAATTIEEYSGLSIQPLVKMPDITVGLVNNP